jgi:hypothetical protein
LLMKTELRELLTLLGPVKD